MPEPAAAPLKRPWLPAARPPTRRAVCLCCLGGLAAAQGLPAWASTETPGARLPPARADHHLHAQGPAISEALERLKARNPAIFQGIEPAFAKPRSGADVLKLLDAAGIAKGVLLSEAYMFGSPLMAPDNPDVAALT